MMEYRVEKKHIQKIIDLLSIVNIGSFSDISGGLFCATLTSLKDANKSTDDTATAKLKRATIDNLGIILSSRNGFPLFPQGKYATEKERQNRLKFGKIKQSDFADLLRAMYASPVKSARIKQDVLI